MCVDGLTFLGFAKHFDMRTYASLPLGWWEGGSTGRLPTCTVYGAPQGHNRVLSGNIEQHQQTILNPFDDL